MILFQDAYGTVSRDSENNVLTLTWSAKTADMTDEDFQNSNLALAILADEHKATRLVVNVEQFRHNFGPELGGWRMRNVIPIYARAGVDKFAFVHGAGFSGSREGGMSGEPFVSQHFSTRPDALAWFAE